MKSLLLIILLISYSTSMGSEFDESYLWHDAINRPDADSFVYIESGFDAVYYHSNLYRVNTFNWDFMALKLNRGIWGAGVDVSSTGYKQYYRRNRYGLKMRFNPGKNIRLVPSLEICMEKFSNFGNYSEITGGLGICYIRNKYMVESGYSKIDLKRPYPDYTGGEKLKPYVIGSCIFSDGLTFTIGIRRFDARRTRWLFDQYIAVNKYLALNFGYKNNPSNVYGGIDLTIDIFSIIISYYSIGELSDSIIWGISFRK